MRWVGIAGTHGWSDEPGLRWWQQRSPFDLLLLREGLDRLLAQGRGHVWTTDLGGWRAWRRWAGPSRSPRDHRDWIAGGATLRDIFDPPASGPECAVPWKDRNVIAYSHGGQVALYACEQGLKLRRLVTVNTPVRADMRRVADQARGRVEAWVHIWSPVDRWQRLGALGDGALGVEYTFPQADRNSCVPGSGHGAVLHNPRFFPLWRTRGWLAFLLWGLDAMPPEPPEDTLERPHPWPDPLEPEAP